MSSVSGVVLSSLLFSFWYLKSGATAKENSSSLEKFQAKYSIRNSVQAGFEFDSNVYKTFAQSEPDALLRVLLKSRGKIPIADRSLLRWIYQGGGKKFIEQDEQDLIIQYIQLPLIWQAHPRFRITVAPDFKYQNENNKLDNTTPETLDINEDYFSTTHRLQFGVFFPQAFTFEPFGEFTFFHFDPQENFSFFRQRGGATLRKRIGDIFSFGTTYIHSRQQFQQSPREDRENSISGFFRFLGLPFFSNL